MAYNLTAKAKDSMLSRLISSDYYTSGLAGTDNGLVEIVLLERYQDVEGITQEREYTSGQYGGSKEIEWNKFIPVGDTYAQSIAQYDDIVFDIEEGIDIVGFRLYFFDGTSIEVGISHTFDNTIYNFPAEGYLTISNIEITVN